MHESEFNTQHSITLPNLAPDTTYYFKITQTDLSGNTASTNEISSATSAPKKYVYLPLVRR